MCTDFFEFFTCDVLEDNLAQRMSNISKANLQTCMDQIEITKRRR